MQGTACKETSICFCWNITIAEELKITFWDKLLEYKRSWMHHVHRMPRNRLPKVMKHYSPTGRRNHGRPLKRLLDTWERNGSTSGPTPWKIYDDDDDDDETLRRIYGIQIYLRYKSEPSFIFRWKNHPEVIFKVTGFWKVTGNVSDAYIWSEIAKCRCERTKLTF